ncbi:Nucleoside phosphorylase [Stenotrophomonas maltophilia]|nr:Nucleoside phosphorylase [Stenotrophomonas maltophilia]
MIKILVVEDQQEKKQKIIAHLARMPGIGMDNITHVDNVIDAKRKLKIVKFDLLILDINVPNRADEGPSKGAGIEVIRFIRNNDLAISPTYIFGMTAYDDEFSDASSVFSSALWKLVKYRSDDLSWAASLSDAVGFLVSKHRPPYQNDGATFHVDVGLVLALDEELEPYKSLLIDCEEFGVPFDPARYFRGILKSDDRELSVVAVSSPRMGLPAASVIAAKLIMTFRPRYVVTSGICAGVKEKTSIGDLLVSDPVFDWGSGKWSEVEGSGRVFKPAAYPWRLNEDIRREITLLSEEPGLMEAVAKSYDGHRPQIVPRVHIDATASGASVLQVESLMADIRAQHKNLVGIDMENYGILTAVEYCGRPQAKAIAVKSVCDFGDGQKNDSFHGYAAHMSASFVCALIPRLQYE